MAGHVVAWVATMRELGIRQLRTPDGMEIVLGDDPAPAPAPHDEGDAAPKARPIRSVYDDPDLGVPSLVRDDAVRRKHLGRGPEE